MVFKRCYDLLGDRRVDDVTTLFMLLCHMKRIDSVLPWVCSVTSQNTSKCGNNIQ